MNSLDKESFVKSLPKAKLILGNGFDLRCGLYTKYSDYYCKNWKKFHHINKLIKRFINNDEDVDDSIEELKNMNVWDVFFALNSSEDPKENMYRWCDIESLIKDSLIDTAKELDKNGVFKFVLNGSQINWPTVKRIIEHKSENEHDSQGYIAYFVEYKMKQSKWGVERFYAFLLNQLKEFEKEFGDFIYWQLHFGRIEETRFGVINLNELYIERAKHTLNCLCNLETSTIDTFNYSFIEDEQIMSKISYINGSYKEPIFGIDSYFEPADERYIFTKTTRRIESDMNSFSYCSSEEFENIVIFGHSLNEADYSYFFPAFDKIQLLNLTTGGIVVFAYYIWDKKKRDIIEATLRADAAKMIYEYALEKKANNPKRILDSLSIQKKITFYEIPEFPDRLRFPKTYLDNEWDGYHTEIELYEDR